MKVNEKIQLKNVTLLTWNCVSEKEIVQNAGEAGYNHIDRRPVQSIKALIYSSRHIDFAEMILVSDRKPENLPTGIRYEKTNYSGYRGSCHFVYKELSDLVKTEYVLCIQDDGFVINPHLWDDNFLKYDYIGAPWSTRYNLRNRVGNGGFVLKSKKFLELTKKVEYLGGNDDGELTNHYYDYFTKNGCKYAPVEVAMKFSLESRIPECPYDLNNCFGFHGVGNPNSIALHQGEYHQFQEKCRLLDEVTL